MYSVRIKKCRSMIPIDTAYNCDCFNILPEIEDGSVDMILTDVPYNLINLSWDKEPLDLEKFWLHHKRIIKKNGAIVMTASQPFTSKLVMSNEKMFKYEWIWNKIIPTGHLIAHRMPMKVHENVLVFCDGTPIYNRQFLKRSLKDQRPNYKTSRHNKKQNEHWGMTNRDYATDYDNSKINPKSIIIFSAGNAMDRIHSIHPTQKPVALFEYLIRTYTSENDRVFDGFAGSFTTSVACDNTNRNWICVERDEKYYMAGLKRINENRDRLNRDLFRTKKLPFLEIKKH